MTIRAPKGTDDIIPPASQRWRELLVAWEELTAVYGYGLSLTPIIELTELFARGVGEDTDVVEKQMYTFEDKAGRSLTLRPEATASVVRAYLAAGAPGVFKAAYAGPMFRYEQPQAGRRRQFFQVGIEYLGEPDPAADLEVIELGYRFIVDAGVPDLVVLLNSIGDAEDRASYRNALVAYLEERRGDLSEDSRRRIESNPLRILDSKEDAKLLAEAPATFDYLSSETKSAFDAVQSGLESRNIPHRLDARLVRGLDYYNRTVFEYLPTSYDAAQSAVGGGGRYDGLAEVLGGRPTPGVGFALGLDRIILAAGQRSSPGLDVFVVATDAENRQEAMAVLERFRAGDVRADMVLGPRSVKAQMKAADRLGAARAVMVGAPGESVTVRDLETGEQQEMTVDAVLAEVANT